MSWQENLHARIQERRASSYSAPNWITALHARIEERRGKHTVESTAVLLAKARQSIAIRRGDIPGAL